MDARVDVLFGLMAVFAYLVGSVNISLLVSRFAGAGDIRNTGSGNAGATNLFRTAGPRFAVPVLLAEMGKAVGVIWLGRCGGSPELAPLLAVPLVLGNLYPLFHRFRGGKGVAAATGATLAISPMTFLLSGLVFLVMFGGSKRISVGSLAMAASWALVRGFTGGVRLEWISLGLLGVLVFFSHRSNVRRLIRGEEAKFTFRRDRAQ